MKAILEFDLPMEHDEWEMYESAPRMRRALTDFREWLRSARKHRETPPDVDEVWDEFHEILIDSGVEL